MKLNGWFGHACAIWVCDNQSSEALNALKHVWKTWIWGQVTGDKLCTLSRLLHAPVLLEPTLAVWKWNQAQCLNDVWEFMMKAGTDARPRCSERQKNSLKDIKIQQMKLQAALHVAFVEKCSHSMCCIGKKTIITGQFYAIFMSALVFLCLL